MSRFPAISDTWDREGWEREGWEREGWERDSAELAAWLEPESGEAWDDRDSALPEALAADSTWAEAYDLGVTYQDAVREAIGPEAATLTDDDVDALLAEVTAGFSPLELESFWKSLGNVAKSVGKAAAGLAPTVLPMLGGAVGTFVGGPVGTALGAQLGQLAGGAVGQLAGRAPSLPRRIPAPPPRPVRPHVRPPAPRQVFPGGPPSAVPPGGSSATAQLAALVQNPALIQSLLGALMGGAGTVKIGESAVDAPFGAFMTALESLAAEAAAEVHARHPQPNEIPAYLIGSDGEAIEGLTVGSTRAAHLLSLLHG